MIEVCPIKFTQKNQNEQNKMTLVLVKQCGQSMPRKLVQKQVNKLPELQIRQKSLKVQEIRSLTQTVTGTM